MRELDRRVKELEAIAPKKPEPCFWCHCDEAQSCAHQQWGKTSHEEALALLD